MATNRDLILRVTLLAAAALLAFILANMAATLIQVWQLKTGALIPAPWDVLLGSNRVDQRSHSLSLLGAALLAGASLACLLFFVERLIKAGWAWLQGLMRR